MKITDVTVTLFAWDDIPPTRYAVHTGLFSGRSQLGLVTLSTDEGIAGHAFLGSASYSAELDAVSLVAKVPGYGRDEKTSRSAANGMWDTMIAFARGRMARREVLPEERLSVSCFGPSV